MVKVQKRQGTCLLKLDLRFDLREIARPFEPDWALPELQGAKPQGQALPANNKMQEGLEFNSATKEWNFLV